LGFDLRNWFFDKMLRPILRGVHQQVGNKTVWEGSWCMREVDFANPLLCAQFKYERTGIYKSDDNKPGHKELQDGLYSGHFIVNPTIPNGTATKYSEKNVLIQFEENPEDPNMVTVEGSGSNKIGKFTLKGSLNRKENIMTVVREYATKKMRRNGLSQARVARELDLGNRVITPAANKKTTIPVSEEADEKANLVLNSLSQILDELMELDTNKWFCSPVNAKALGLLDYHNIIDKPMDLGTVKTKYEKHMYSTPQEMRDDIELTFSNAIHYNPRGHGVYRMAISLQEKFQSRYQMLMSEPVASEISTPAAPPSFRRIGKRHSIRKIVFEPEQHSKFHSDSAHSPDGQDLDRKRKKNNEIERLQEQVRLMSEQIASFGSTMLQKQLHTEKQIKYQAKQQQQAAFDIDYLPEAEGFYAPEPKRVCREASFEDKRKLGRDIQLLPGDKIGRVVEIIEACGNTLPVSQDTGEVELDIDSLDYGTIQKLRKFVSRHVD